MRVGAKTGEVTLTKPELDLMVGHAEVGAISLIAGIETVAIMLHDKASPTNWLLITPEQRNNSRKRANEVINEALLYWNGEVRKRSVE